jgi:hypothetical protein
VAAKSSPDSITLTYDLLKWAIPALKKFPRDQRFLLGDRIENLTLNILELFIDVACIKLAPSVLIAQK